MLNIDITKTVRLINTIDTERFGNVDRKIPEHVMRTCSKCGKEIGGNYLYICDNTTFYRRGLPYCERCLKLNGLSPPQYISSEEARFRKNCFGCGGRLGGFYFEMEVLYDPLESYGRQLYCIECKERISNDCIKLFKDLMGYSRLMISEDYYDYNPINYRILYKKLFGQYYLHMSESEFMNNMYDMVCGSLPEDEYFICCAIVEKLQPRLIQHKKTEIFHVVTNKRDFIFDMKKRNMIGARADYEHLDSCVHPYKIPDWTKESFIERCTIKNHKILDYRKRKLTIIEKELENIPIGIELHFHISGIDKIPPCIGVYIFTVKMGQIYVGRSDNVRIRIYQHDIKQKMYPIETIIVIRTDTHENSKKLEKFWIAKLGPEINRNVELQR